MSIVSWCDYICYLLVSLLHINTTTAFLIVSSILPLPAIVPEELDLKKIVALKKAYAEIILNTAKEAAARAMASERKALRSHHDLCYMKDEAVQMLLRFKRMIDVKMLTKMLPWNRAPLHKDTN